MNISTGGPHILLFERDQQLATLLTSQFQLAGYECHIARTAVEVFDAIARFPVRLVLVDLAQAAAGRREFWVALDTQRRGRGVQVFTFHCTNLAGYGPRDPDEHTQMMMADMDVDGMGGLMNLVEAVRLRVPGVGSMTNTVPRIPKASVPPPTSPSMGNTPATSYSSPASTSQATSGTSYRSGMASDSAGLQASARVNPIAFTQPPVTTQMSPDTYTGPLPPTSQSSTAFQAASTQSYSDKIRAVLYPNQRTWSPQGGNNAAATPEPLDRATEDMHNPSMSMMPTPPNDSTVLQRLASGQMGMEGQRESGLAQLSRMVRDHYVSPSDTVSTAYQPRETSSATSTQASPLNTATEQAYYGNNATALNGTTAYPSTRTQAAEQGPYGNTTNSASMYASTGSEQTLHGTTGSMNYAPPPSATRPAMNETIGTQPLRASPIQDIPVERAVGGQEGGRRSDMQARMNYGQQMSQTMATPLASMATPAQPMPPPPAPVQSAPRAMAAPQAPTTIVTEQPMENEEAHRTTGNLATRDKGIEHETIVDDEEERDRAMLIEQIRASIQMQSSSNTRLDLDETSAPSNAMLLDIVQSLPPMPPVSQPVQPQALNGRATRSLGSVLLEGHLVPQSRLEVAQNIQRMLRGVDLNYQLGEILLMFKLLSPDQLLAASLVSYGMITTTQISALGRIRQELHSIGLEYDLENLIILFRILTPEQLREVRASWQS